MASHLADFPFLSKVLSGLPPRFLGAADGVIVGVLRVAEGVNFGGLGVASPVELTLGFGRIGSE